MEQEILSQAKRNWLNFPIIATITRLLCKELTLQNEYLRAENKILKSKINKRVHFTDDERRILVDAALAMGRDLMKQIVSIVKPETILAWQRRLERAKWDYSHRRKKLGRPRIANEIEQLVCQMARENRWGYKRIQGELKKLSIAISKGTVANILYRNNLPPSPERNGLTWREFLAHHEDVFLCSDFFTKEIWTFKGLQTAYIFFVIHLGTRQLLYTHATFSPHTEWLKQQARQMMWECDEQGIQPQCFLHDNDSCFSKAFDSLLGDLGMEVIKTPFKAPNANEYYSNCTPSFA